MRISDWSSDVCSSDLVPVARLSHYADLAENYPFDDELEDIDFRGVVSQRRIRYEPMGVVAGIIPWNGPWGSGLSKVGPAPASGRVIILQPSDRKRVV